MEQSKYKREAEAASYLAISKSLLSSRRRRGDGPVHIRLGKAVLYNTEDLDAWVQSNRREHEVD